MCSSCVQAPPGRVVITWMSKNSWGSLVPLASLCKDLRVLGRGVAGNIIPDLDRIEGPTATGIAQPTLVIGPSQGPAPGPTAPSDGWCFGGTSLALAQGKGSVAFVFMLCFWLGPVLNSLEEMDSLSPGILRQSWLQARPPASNPGLSGKLCLPRTQGAGGSL